MFPPGGFVDRFGDPLILHQHHHQINILMYPIQFPIISINKKKKKKKASSLTDHHQSRHGCRLCRQAADRLKTLRSV